jgi:predicted MFS family arabinose efflux permease
VNRRIVLPLCLAEFVCALDATIMIVAAPAAQSGLHLSDASRNWATGVYLFAFGGLLLVGGRITDLAGPRMPFLAGTLAFAAAALAGAVATTPAVLVASRGLQGAAAAVFAPAALALVAGVLTDAARRAQAFALAGAAGAVGAVGGLVAGGVLTAEFGWRANLVLIASIALTAFGSGVFALRDERRGSAEVPGAALRLPLRILRDRDRVASLLASLACGVGTYTTLVFASYYLQLALGLSPVGMGTALLPTAIVMAATSVLASTVLVRYTGPRALVPSGLGLGAVSMLGLAALGSGSYLAAALPLITAGAGLGLVTSVAASLATAGLGSGELGTAAALFYLAGPLGGAFGVALLNTGTASQPPDRSGSFQMFSAAYADPYRIAAVVLIILAAACLALYRPGTLAGRVSPAPAAAPPSDSCDAAQEQTCPSPDLPRSSSRTSSTT